MKRMSCILSILWIQRCLGENHIIKVIYGAHAFQASYYYLSMLFKRTKKHLFDTIHLKMQCNPFASIILRSVSLSLFGRVLLRRLATKLRTLKRLNMCGFCVVNIDSSPFLHDFFFFFILLLLLLLLSVVRSSPFVNRSTTYYQILTNMLFSVDCMKSSNQKKSSECMSGTQWMKKSTVNAAEYPRKSTNIFCRPAIYLYVWMKMYASVDMCTCAYESTSLWHCTQFSFKTNWVRNSRCYCHGLVWMHAG